MYKAPYRILLKLYASFHYLHEHILQLFNPKFRIKQPKFIHM